MTQEDKDLLLARLPYGVKCKSKLIFDREILEDLLSSNKQIVHYCYEHDLDINGLIERGIALERK